MARPAAGGRANINGVIYQMLWSLLRAVSLYTKDRQDAPDGTIQRAVLILEPLGGGGDLQEERGAARSVEQLKACAGDATWSLRKVVEEVFPDLYLAYDASRPDTEYRFVTEGRMGAWSRVYRAFQDFAGRSPVDGDVLSALDAVRPLPFHSGRRQADDEPDDASFWGRGPHTERSIFEKIVQIVRGRKAVEERETVEQTRVGVWHLLSHFTLVPEKTMDRLRTEIDALLLALIDSDATLEEKLQAMLGGLAERATRGETVALNTFLKDYRLDSTPLTDWSRLRENARRHLNGVLSRLRYLEPEDVRSDAARRLVSGWEAEAPILALSGESGTGKSWLLYGLALAVSAGPQISIFLEATGDAERDCQRAADVFMRSVKGNPGTLPLEHIAARRQKLLRDPGWWLTIVFDNVPSAAEARQLALQPWESWKVRLAMSCSPELARTVKAVADERSRIAHIGDFPPPELRDYLFLRLGELGDAVPLDVKRTLARPLLARIYGDLTLTSGA
jgi:hypothetical protein